MVVKSRLAVPHGAVGPPADIVAKLSLDRLTLFCHIVRGVILALSQGYLPGKFSLPFMVKLTLFCYTARGVILAVWQGCLPGSMTGVSSWQILTSLTCQLNPILSYRQGCNPDNVKGVFIRHGHIFR